MTPPGCHFATAHAFGNVSWQLTDTHCDDWACVTLIIDTHPGPKPNRRKYQWLQRPPTSAVWLQIHLYQVANSFQKRGSSLLMGKRATIRRFKAHSYRVEIFNINDLRKWSWNLLLFYNPTLGEKGPPPARSVFPFFPDPDPLISRPELYNH